MNCSSSSETGSRHGRPSGPAADFSNDVLELLEAHWDPERGYCVPNPRTYPHLWLWDSCFHAVVWAHLGDARAVQELAAVLEGQLPGGLVPHMRYADTGPDTFLGPLSATSSLAQPPMFGHAIKVLADHGIAPPPPTSFEPDEGWNGCGRDVAPS